MPTEDTSQSQESQAPIPLATFATMLRPQLVASSPARSRTGGQTSVIRTYTQGHPDEIWLKLLEVNHGISGIPPASGTP